MASVGDVIANDGHRAGVIGLSKEIAGGTLSCPCISGVLECMEGYIGPGKANLELLYAGKRRTWGLSRLGRGLISSHRAIGPGPGTHVPTGSRDWALPSGTCIEAAVERKLRICARGSPPWS